MGRKEGTERVASESPRLPKQPYILHPEQRWLVPSGGVSRHRGAGAGSDPTGLAEQGVRQVFQRGGWMELAAMATDAGSAVAPPLVCPSNLQLRAGSSLSLMTGRCG